MVTSAAILLAAILVLGGLIAVLGDRLGTKVGKARLRLFGMRPRQTATAIAILTGTAIAASTLAVLFAFSKPLRQGVFEIDEILRQKRIAEGDLWAVQQEKARVEAELAKVTRENAKVQQGLIAAQNLFNQTNQQVSALNAEVKNLRSEREKLRSERQELIRQRDELLKKLRSERQELTRQRDELVRAFQVERERVTRERQRLTQQRDELLAKIPELQARVGEQEQELGQRRQTIRQNEEQIAAQDKILQEREKRLQQLQVQRQTLQAELDRRDEEIAQRDRAIAELDNAIAQRDAALKQREASLAELETQLDLLQQQIASLAQEYQGLRQGTVAIARGQVLGFGVVRILDPSAARSAIDQLLRQANRNAIAATQPNNSTAVTERVVQITQAQVEELIERINDGQDYVVRILSAGNYVEQEKNIFVIADVALNREIFNRDEAIAAVSLDAATPSRTQLEDQLDLLLAASQFRARRAGLLGEIQVGEGEITTLEQIGTLTQFIDQILKAEEPIDRIQAIATETTYTAGPLKLKLVAMQKGEVVFSTQS